MAQLCFELVAIASTADGSTVRSKAQGTNAEHW